MIEVMGLENTFYVIGIIFMSLSVLILICIVVLVFYLKKKVDSIHREIDEKMQDFNVLVANPVKGAAKFASAIISGKSKK